MRHRTRFSFPAAVLGAFALIACAGSATASSTRSLAATATGGVSHTCVLTRTGGVQCWGYNGHDELGTGGNDLPSSLTPVSVDGMAAGVTAIYAGVRHSCAVTRAGGAKCWGANYQGALGDGTSGRHSSPVAVLGLSSGVTGVSAGHDYSCGLVMGGVKCWGEGYEPTPTDIPGLGSGVTQISSGTRDSCALTEAGGVKCWGYHYGPTAVDIPGLSRGVMALAKGSPFCVLTSGRGVKCWGAGTNWTPIDVPGAGSGVTALASDGGHTCALGGSGGVRCWGSNEFGQLGDGTMIDRLEPVDVVGLTSGVAAIGLGFFHSCAVTRSGGVKCWGLDTEGKKRLRPVDIVGFGPPPVRCVVPNVVGKRLAKARVRIMRAHCRVGMVTRVASTRSRSLVVRQSPRPGKRLPAGSRISLSVGR